MTHVIREFESQPFFGRQLTQAMLQPILNFSLESGIDGLFWIIVQALRGAVILLPPPRLQRRPVGDADDPGGDLRGVAKILGALPDDHERIVDDLFDILIARRESRQETRETPVIAEVQLFQCLATSRRDGEQQIIVMLLSRIFGQYCHRQTPLLLLCRTIFRKYPQTRKELQSLQLEAPNDRADPTPA